MDSGISRIGRRKTNGHDRAVLSSLLLFPILLYGCGLLNNSSQEPTVRELFGRPDPAQLESFWGSFREAVEAGNAEAIAALTDFPLASGAGGLGKIGTPTESISREEFFRYYYPLYFQNGDWKKALLAKNYRDIEITGQGYSMKIILTKITDGVESFQSGWTLFFRGYDDGSFRLAAMSFAG